MERQFICTRQRAGRLVTEMRMNLPRRLQGDSPEARLEKNVILRSKANFSKRKLHDRAELYLAIIDQHRDALAYNLTYDDVSFPKSYREMKLHLAAFRKSLRLRIGGNFLYAYAAEASHGNGRPHFHFVVRPNVKEEWIRKRWVHGSVYCSKLLTRDEIGGYHGKGVYFTKEPTGRFLPVGAHAFQASREVYKALPPAEKFLSNSELIPIPDGASDVITYSTSNDFGSFYYAKFLVKK